MPQRSAASRRCSLALRSQAIASSSRGCSVSLFARTNNLLNQDFTSFQTVLAQNPDGSWTPTYTDDFNNKDKARNLWLSLNVAF